MKLTDFELSLAEAQDFCLKRGLKVARQTITKAGLRWGWAKYTPLKELRISKTGLLAWVNKHDESPDDGWVLISEASKITGMPISTIYVKVNAKPPEIRSKVLGVGKGRGTGGRRHVFLEDVKNAK